MLNRLRKLNWPLVLVLAFTAGMGLLCIHEFKSSPFFEIPIIDEEGYVGWAERIAAGDAPDQAFYQDPLYPYFLAGLFLLFGKNLLAVRLAQMAMAVASVALVHGTGRRLGGARLGLLAAGALALYPGAYFFALLVLKEAMTLLLAAAALYLGVRAAERPDGKAGWAVLGLALGALALLRGNILLIIPAVLAWAAGAVGERRGPPALVRAGLVAAGVVVVLAPVTLRNYRASGEFVLTTSQAGSNFYIGNNPEADGRYVILSFVRANPRWQAEDFRTAAERRTGRAMTPAEASRFWMRQGWQWMREHPGDALRLGLVKAWLIIHQYEVPDNQSFYLVRAEFVPALRIAFLGFGLLTGPALVGGFLLVRRDRRAWFPALFAVAYFLALLPFFIVARYRLPLAPAGALFAAYFVIWTAERLRVRALPPLLPAGLTVAALLVIGLWPRPEPAAVTAYGHYLLGTAYLKSGDPARALQWIDRSREVLPEREELLEGWWGAVSALGPGDADLVAAEADRTDRGPDELYELGRRLEELGRPEDAVEVYRRVVEREPAHMAAYARLAALLARRPGGCREAEEFLRRAAALRPDYAGRDEYRETEAAIARCREAAGE